MIPINRIEKEKQIMTPKEKRKKKALDICKKGRTRAINKFIKETTVIWKIYEKKYAEIDAEGEDTK